MSLQVGQKAPEFTVLSDENKPVSLKDFYGKKVVLYFYPKDSTPGCTKESCDFRDHIEQFRDLNAVVLGVSRDSVESHVRFKSNYGFPFILLADTESKVCQAYQVLVQKSLFGKKYQGLERRTFLIDENGIIQAIWPKVKVLKHVKAVLEVLKQNRPDR